MIIKLNGHFITVKTKETGDNYTIFANVFKNNDNNPLFGTSFKEGTNKETIKQWAQMKLNTQNNPLNELFSYFNINP